MLYQLTSVLPLPREPGKHSTDTRQETISLIQVRLCSSSRLEFIENHGRHVVDAWTASRKVQTREYNPQHPGFERHKLAGSHKAGRFSSELVLQSPHLSCAL
jgi:hypothetical protein